MTAFTVPLADFRRIAEIAGKSASTDKFTSAFTYIRFRVADSSILSATATDRYAISTARVEFLGAAPDCEFFLTVAECAAIFRTFNPARAAQVYIRIEATGQAVEVSRDSGLLKVGGDATLRFEGFDGEYPSKSIDSLIRRVASAPPAGTPVPMDSAKLRRLPADSAGCHIAQSDNGATGFFTDSWAVLIMQVRRDDRAEVLAGWSA